jgi:hypothetical protein
MARRIVRDCDESILEQPADAEHRRISGSALCSDDVAASAEAAARLRARFRSRVDSTGVIRAARDDRAE